MRSPRKIHNWSSGAFWRQWSVQASGVLIVLETLDLVAPLLKASELPAVATFVTSAWFQVTSLAVSVAIPVLRNFKQGG